jgi:predicted ATPase
MPYLSHKDKNFLFDLPAGVARTRSETRVTVAIGANGTGKSQLLRSVAELARNRRQDSELMAESRTNSFSRVLAISNLTADVFVNTSRDLETYRYLGLRQSSNSSSTGAVRQATLVALFSYLIDRPNIDGMRPVFDQLGIKDVEARFARVRKSNKRSSPLDALRKELNLLPGRERTGDEAYVRDLDIALNEFERVLDWPVERAGLRSPEMDEFKTLQGRFGLRLEDLLRLARRLHGMEVEFRVRIRDVFMSLDELSSGQLLLLSTFARMLANCAPGSLVLIDEPELGLHPNWQSDWTPLVRDSLRNVPDVHVIAATHSPFLVSDADDVLIPTGTWGRFELFNDPFQGRSIENILYRVFGARVVGNQMVEQDLTTLISFIEAGGEREAALEGLTRLRALAGADTPDLNSIIRQATAALS